MDRLLKLFKSDEQGRPGLLQVVAPALVGLALLVYSLVSLLKVL